MVKNQNYNKIVKIWIFLCINIVGIIILVGGLTRLTNSGLSITEWELFSGILPPLTDQKWNDYFELYKLIPQFYLLNDDMSLEQFKIIFYWEYFHRLLARFFGLFFLIPFIYFFIKGVLKKNTTILLSLIFLLIIFQGLIGWYMVQSGLVNNVSVSHYRLSLHLFTAFIIISMLFWLYLNMNYKNYLSFFFSLKRDYLISLFVFFIYLQIILGAFVSGLDAGKIYQTWPLMNTSYVPDDLTFKSINDFFNFNDQSFVQFIHRNVAYLIFFIYLIIGSKIFFYKISHIYKSFIFLSVFIFFQIILGIFTLLSNLSLYISSLHQICGIFLVISTLAFTYNYFNKNSSKT